MSSVGPGGVPVVRFVGSGECPERRWPAGPNGPNGPHEPHEPLMVLNGEREVPAFELRIPERTNTLGVNDYVTRPCRHCGSAYTTIEANPLFATGKGGVDDGASGVGGPVRYEGEPE